MDASWEFRSIPVEPRAGEAEEFARRIGAAFRVGTGLDGVVRWTWETGHDGRCAVSADGAEARRWVQRVLLPAYPVGQWVPTVEPRRVGPPSPLSFAVGVPDAIGPFRSVSEELGSWVEPILGLLGGWPGGVQLRWELQPLRSSRGSRAPPPDAELVRQPPGFRAGTPPMPRRSIADRLEERRLGPHWAVSGTLYLTEDGAGPSDLERLARVVEAASRREGGSGLGFRPRVWLWRRRAPLVVLSSGEAAALLPTPWARYVTSGSAVPTPARRLPIGRDSQGLPASIWIEPGQGRHLLVLGETGMGKSSLLVRLARQLGPESSLLVFDPIGGTARSVMAALPPSAFGRLLWVSPVHSPVGINALASLRPAPGASPWRAERARGDLVGALRRVRALRYVDTPFWGPRIEELLTQSITAAAAIPGGTLVDAERLLAEPGRSPHGIPPEAQGPVEELRRWVLDRPEAIDGTRRLLSEITRSPVLTRMLCQREPRSTVSDWVRPGRVTIISGEAGEVGESAARYLLSVLLALSWAELLSGPGGSKTVLALDEAQWYAHESVSEVLRMGRDRNVHLWLATQALASLPDGVREAAQTNAADFVIYRGSPEEAREFHRWAPVVREETLLSLPRGRAVLLRGKSESISWVTIDPCAPARSVEDALRLATESSRPSWVPEEGEASEGPDARPGGSGAPAAPDAGEAEKLRPILLVIWAGLLDADPAARIEVPVGPLRQELDPTGAVVRRVGAELARVGALSDNRREPDGRVWVVERVGIPELLGGGVGAEELALATTRWRQIARSARGAAR